MERITQIYLPDIRIVKDPANLIEIRQNREYISIEKQSIPALIEALKKYI